MDDTCWDEDHRPCLERVGGLANLDLGVARDDVVDLIVGMRLLCISGASRQDIPASA
jgi:hypothetical protein